LRKRGKEIHSSCFIHCNYSWRSQWTWRRL